LLERSPVEERHWRGLLGAELGLREHRPRGPPLRGVARVEVRRERRERLGRRPAPAADAERSERICLADVDIEHVLVVRLAAADQLPGLSERRQRELLELVLELL